MTRLSKYQAGRIEILNQAGDVVHSHDVQSGDIWRMCRVKDAPIQDWVKLAVERGRITGSTVIFWLDAGRAHDAQLIAKIEEYLPRHNTEGLDISILKPAEATKTSLALMRQGKDTISRLWQCPARLPNGFVSYFRIGYQRQNAVYRAVN